jgi:hypothetical protein
LNAFIGLLCGGLRYLIEIHTNGPFGYEWLGQWVRPNTSGNLYRVILIASEISADGEKSARTRSDARRMLAAR